MESGDGRVGNSAGAVRFDGGAIICQCVCGRAQRVGVEFWARPEGDGSEGREVASGETDGGGAVGGGTEGGHGPVGQTPWNDIMTPAATAARLKHQAALARWGTR